jgi:hypothetical protein
MVLFAFKIKGIIGEPEFYANPCDTLIRFMEVKQDLPRQNLYEPPPAVGSRKGLCEMLH